MGTMAALNGQQERVQERAAAALLHEKASGHTGTVLNVRRELDVDGRAGRGKAVLLSMIIKAC